MPTSYSYQWLRCDTAGANCTTISTPDQNTYVLTGADTNKRLRVNVTATNAQGSTIQQVLRHGRRRRAHNVSDGTDR